MKRLTNKLLIVLAVQLLAMVWMFWPSALPGAEDAENSLLTVAGEQVDRLLISDADSKLEMRRDEDAWRMPEYHNLTVQDSLVERLLDELPGMSRGFPIAGSSGAKQRFEVAADNFQRRVQYFAGEEQLAQLFLGTSPGFRQIHVRPGQEDLVYSIEFNSYDLPVNSTHWLDKTLLQVEEPSAISGLDYRIQRSDGQWRGEDGAAASETAVERITNGLASLRVTGAADEATAAILEEMAAPPVLSVSAGDTVYDYHLYEIEETYYIRRSDIPVFFALSKFDYDRLNDTNASTLFPPPEEDAAAEPESADADNAEPDNVDVETTQ